MAEGAGQEGFFWDAHPWVITDKPTTVSGEGGSEKKSTGDKNNLLDLTIDTNKSHMKQPEIGGMDDSSGVDRAATTVCGACRRNVDDSEKMKNEEETKVSVHGDKGKRKIEPSDDELLIWTERERRQKMKNMFHQLHALIPHLPPKADKCKVVDEAVSYIKTLEQTLQNLETKKVDRLYGLISTDTTNASLIQPPQVAASDTRESFLANQGSSTGHFGIGSPPGSTSFSFQLHSPKVFRTWASSNVTLHVCGPDAHINICSPGKLIGLFTAICLVLEKHKLEIVSADISSDESKSMFMIHAHTNTRDPFMETLPYDDIYEQAATEIMQLVNSKSS